MTRKHALPPVDTYALISDGIESPIAFGIRRACKYGAVTLDDQQVDLIAQKVHDELMIWFSETFRFEDRYDDE